MKTAAFIAFTKAGSKLASTLAAALDALDWTVSVAGPERFAAELGIECYESLDAWTEEHFAHADALVFICAAGIAVRAIAPHVSDKFTDPAVVQMDEAGAFATPLLSGHVGGANDLARMLATISGGQALVSTATDVNGLIAVDEWARKQGLIICERDLAKELSAALLDGATLGFACDFKVGGPLPAGLEAIEDGGAARRLGIHVTYDETSRPFDKTLHLVPRNVVLGAGCRKGIDPEHFALQVAQVLHEEHIAPRAIKALASVDLKAHEAALLEYAKQAGCALAFYTPDELAATEGTFSHSDFVQRTLGVDNVCERAAVRASGGELLVAKRACDGVTVALAAERISMSFEARTKPQVSVVGLGPGGKDSMTVAARACIESADLVVGYTVYVDLVKAQFPDKATMTTPMRKEIDRCRMAFEQAALGKRVAMVCSGDPGVYGMAGLIYELGVEYPDVAIEIVPGVSAANGGAAVLGAALMHDYAVISLSDLLTPWEKIEKRLHAAGEADFCLCLYNPSSHKRPDYLQRACDILLTVKAADTVCGFVRNIGRAGQESHITTLGALRDTPVDMFTTVFIGNSQTKVIDGHMVTPRGYLTRED